MAEFAAAVDLDIIATIRKRPRITGPFPKRGTSVLLRGLRRFRMLVDFGFGQLAQRAVGVLFFLEGCVQQLHCILVTQLVSPGHERAVPGNLIMRRTTANPTLRADGQLSRVRRVGSAPMARDKRQPYELQRWQR